MQATQSATDTAAKAALQDPTLIFVCGWPASGKTSLAMQIQQKFGLLGIVDIDEVRAAMISMPDPHSNRSEEARKRDGQEMGGAYRFVFDSISWHLEMGRSVLAVATLSNEVHGQRKLEAIYSNFPQARVRIIQCIPENDAADAVAAIFKQRAFGADGYKGGVNSPERYFEVKSRFNPIKLPHIEVATWGTDATPETELGLVIPFLTEGPTGAWWGTTASNASSPV